MEKQRWEESERRREEVRRSEKKKREKKEDAGARKGRKVAIHYVFPMTCDICGSGGSKSNLAKAAGAEPAGQMRDEKLHAVVARSTFRSQNVQGTPFSDHFWKLRCRKSARRCGGKTFPRQKNAKNTTCSDHFWTFRCRFVWQARGIVHLVKSEQNVTDLCQFQLQLEIQYTIRNYIIPHYTTLHYTTPHYTTYTSLHSTTLHYTTRHYTTLHYTTYSTLHYNTFQYTTFRFTTLYYTTLR